MTLLKSALIIGMISSSAMAGGLDLNVKTGQAVCLKREYTAEHMAKNPTQKLSAIYFKVEGKVAHFEQEKFPYKAAQVVGISNETFYANSLANCDFQKGGKLHCYVDCDGGAFDVIPNKKKNYAMLKVRKNYYFPIFKSGEPEYGDNSKEGDMISLNAGTIDADYRVYPAPLEACDNAYEQYKMMKPEGC